VSIYKVILKGVKVRNIKARPTAYNTAYMLRDNSLALRGIAHFGRNVVYAGAVIRNWRVFRGEFRNK